MERPDEPTQVQRRSNRKTALLAAAFFVAGLFVDGAGELITQPLLKWAGNVAFEVATLGLTSLQDSVYASVAEMQPNAAGVQTLAMLTGLFSALCTFSIIMWLTASSRSGVDRLTRVVLVRPPAWFARTVALILALSAGSLLISSFRTSYVFRLISGVDQLQRTIAPHIAENERLLYTARISATRTRAEFVAIWQDMATIAKANGKPVPEVTFY